MWFAMIDVARPPRPFDCLIAEDQALIGMALQACLEDAGFRIAGPYGTAAAAIERLGTEMPSVAVVDYWLKDGCCLALVRALRFRNVPVLIYSGMRRTPDFDPEFQDCRWLEKPTDRASLLKAIIDLAGADGGPGSNPLPARAALGSLSAGR
jgi:DNA-binding response OmpR family regulator